MSMIKMFVLWSAFFSLKKDDVGKPQQLRQLWVGGLPGCDGIKSCNRTGTSLESESQEKGCRNGMQLNGFRVACLSLPGGIFSTNLTLCFELE